MVTIKTKEEINILREGGKRHAFILRELAGMVKPGVTSLELENRARELIAEGGDEASFLNYKPFGAKRPYPAALCVSVNDEVVHGIPNEGDKVLKEGDIVTLDLGLTHKGLVTDSAVTVPVGKISPELTQYWKLQKKLFMLVSGLQKGGTKLVILVRLFLGWRFHSNMVLLKNYQDMVSDILYMKILMFQTTERLEKGIFLPQGWL
jgi:methionyl aminopeptidase